MLIGGAVFAGLLIGISVSRSAWVAAPFVVGAGYASMLMINTINATVQANVSDALRGRVMSLYVTVFAGSAPLGGLFSGAVAEAFGTPLAFVAGSVLSIAVLGIVAVGLRRASRRGELGVTLLDTSSRRPAPAAPEAQSPSAAR
jgi:MFS family permease